MCGKLQIIIIIALRLIYKNMYACCYCRIVGMGMSSFGNLLAVLPTPDERSEDLKKKKERQKIEKNCTTKEKVKQKKEGKQYSSREIKAWAVVTDGENRIPDTL